MAYPIDQGLIQLLRLIGGNDKHEPLARGACPVKETVNRVAQGLGQVFGSLPEQGVRFVDQQDCATGVRRRPVEYFVYFGYAVRAQGAN